MMTPFEVLLPPGVSILRQTDFELTPCANPTTLQDRDEKAAFQLKDEPVAWV